jgi:hypothetical protein
VYDFCAVDAADVVKPGFQASICSGRVGQDTKNMESCCEQSKAAIPQSFCSGDDCSFPMVRGGVTGQERVNGSEIEP